LLGATPVLVSVVIIGNRPRPGTVRQHTTAQSAV